MNSILQSLNNSKLLIQYCLKNKYEDDLNTTLSRMKGSLFKSYAQLVHSMWSKRDGSVTPQDFKSKIAFYAPRFVGYSQQDAQGEILFVCMRRERGINLFLIF
jgi:ubiquitin C-terminal hydrolase